MSAFNIVILALLALLALTSALPTNSNATVCAQTSSFTITNFFTFTPASPNTHLPIIAFKFANNANSTSTTQCTHVGAVNASATLVCNDGNAVFRWNGSKLTVGIVHIPCLAASSGEISALGDLDVGVYCYPSPAQLPDGTGTACQTPTGSVSGSFSTGTLGL